MVGSEACGSSLTTALANVRRNGLEERVRLVRAGQGELLGALLERQEGDFHFSMCNPPFYRWLVTLDNNRCSV